MVKGAMSERVCFTVMPCGMKGEQYVFVPDENNIAHRRAVRIGRRLPGKVEILAGLQEGESIVVEGGYRLQEGVPVVSNVKP